MSDRERRAAATLEVRDGPGAGKLGGYAVVWESLSGDLGGFREKFVAGAFSDSLRKTEVLCYDGHSGKILGRQSAGTLRVSEDGRGLAFECDLPDTSYARDLAASVARGDIKGASFEFRTDRDGQTWGKVDGKSLRTITKAELYAVNPVPNPAYPDTQVALRSLEADTRGLRARLRRLRQWCIENL